MRAAVPEAYISVDVETGGPVPGLYPLLSIGACLVDDLTERFYVELKPGDKLVEAEAVQVSWPGRPPHETVARLEREGVSEAEALSAFAAWVDRVSTGGRPVYLAFNAAFDWAFTHHAFTRLGIPDPFGYAPLDVKAYWAGRIGSTLDETRKSKLPPGLTGGPWRALSSGRRRRRAPGRGVLTHARLASNSRLGRVSRGARVGAPLEACLAAPRNVRCSPSPR